MSKEIKSKFIKLNTQFGPEWILRSSIKRVNRKSSNKKYPTRVYAFIFGKLECFNVSNPVKEFIEE